jgi:hypothetical protein
MYCYSKSKSKPTARPQIKIWGTSEGKVRFHGLKKIKRECTELNWNDYISTITSFPSLRGSSRTTLIKGSAFIAITKISNNNLKISETAIKL